MSERWATVDHAPTYQVSTEGRVRRISASRGTSAGKIIKPYPHGSGYMQVSLSVQGTVTKYFVHRLVASAFIPNTEEKTDVAHWNGEKADNRLANIRWATRSENMADTERLGKTARGERNGQAKITAEDVPVIRNLCASGATQAAVGELYNLAGSSVGSICRGENWGHIQ